MSYCENCLDSFTRQDANHRCCLLRPLCRKAQAEIDARIENAKPYQMELDL